MIIKMANDPNQFINYIRYYVENILFKNKNNDKDSNYSESITTAIVGLKNLIKKKDNNVEIDPDDVSEALGTKNPIEIYTIASPISKHLNGISNKDFIIFLYEITKIYTKYKEFYDAGGGALVSEIEAILSQEQNQPPDDKSIEEVTFQEEPIEVPEEPLQNIPAEVLSAWYASSSDSFLKSDDFYGPFSSRLAAVVFSSLIHSPGFNEESSIMTGEKLLPILKSKDPKTLDLSQAKDIHSAPLVNEIIPGKIKNISLEITKGKAEIDLSTSGPVFDKFVEFIGQTISSERNDISMRDMSNWLDSDKLISFPKYYFESEGISTGISDAPEEFSEIDAAIPKGTDTVISSPEPVAMPINKEPKVKPPSKSFDPDFNKLNAPAKEILQFSSITKDLKISIVSQDNSDILSDVSISEFFNKMKSEVKLLDSIDPKSINRSYDASFEKLESFFKTIINRDFETKKELKNFREKNKLEISVDINYEWEYRERFSILKRILSDYEVFESLSSIIGKLANSRFFDGPEARGLRTAMNGSVSSFINNNGVRDAPDVEDAVDDIKIETIQEVLRVVRLELKKNIDKLLSSSGLITLDTSNFLNTVISNIDVKKIFKSKIPDHFFKKQEIISSQKFYMVKCGVCSQMTQIPQRYRDVIESFSAEIRQYSFFRKDGAIITESELIGTDSKRMYGLSSESSRLLSDYLTLSSNMIANRPAEDFSNKKYTWDEVNLMISSPMSFGLSSSQQVEQNIIGLIIRNDILKHHFDAMPSGERGIFANRSLCAASLFDLKDDLKTSESNKKFIAKQQNFECKATIASNYSPNVDVPEYFSSAYISSNGNLSGKKEIDSYFNSGFRFSKNEVRCPCHIDGTSDSIDIALEKKSLKDVFDRIAIPNIPQSLIKDLKFDVDPESIYYPPTTPNGDLAGNLPSAGYVVCGKKVSLSLFDKDPSSQNYIRSILSNIAEKEGVSELVSTVNLMINYGVEMNDLRPHVEAVLSSGLVTKSEKRKTLREIFKKSKVSLAEDFSADSVLRLKNIGLTCEYGHKFTIGQSWNFAKTHFAIVPEGRVRKNLIKDRVRLADVIALAKADPEKAMTMMITSPSDKDTGFGVFKTNVSNDQLIKEGYKQVGEIRDYEELSFLIENKKIYYKSDDGSTYIISKDLSRGALVSAPWESNMVKLIAQTTTSMNLYSGGTKSLTQESEDGGETVSDIEDVSVTYNYEEEEGGAENEERFQTFRKLLDLDFANILFPGIGSAINKIEELPKDSLLRNQESLKQNSSEFVTKLLRALKLSRVWGKLAADYQADFLSKPISTPFASEIKREEQYKSLNLKNKDLYLNSRVESRKNELIQNITNILDSLLVSIGITDDSQENNKKRELVINSFFDSYDILGLMSRTVSLDKVLSLASITQYYLGFSVPFIANLDDKRAKELMTESLSQAINNNLPKILKISDGSNLDSITVSKINDASMILAEYLLSPYEGETYKNFTETAIVDYSGRALIFSFAIDVVERIRSFYSKFFFNQESVLYIGPYGTADKTGISIIEEFLSSTAVGDFSAPKIILMSEEEFNDGFEKIRLSLENMYSPKNLFSNYMAAKRIAVADPSSASKSDAPNVTKRYMIQVAVVFSRFSQALSLASRSIDYISADLAGKPMGSPSIIKAAKILDATIEPLMQQRDPLNFEQNKDRILKSRDLFQEGRSLFSSNSVGTARVNLNPSNENLAPIVSEAFVFNNYQISKDALVGITPDIRISPVLILLKKILVKSKQYLETKKELYLSIVPLNTEIIDSSLIKRNIDIMDFLSPKIIKLNNPQGREFASRYLSELQGLDYSRLVIVDPIFQESTPYRPKEKDPIISDITLKNTGFEIKVAKIDSVPSAWPPPSNLIFDSFNMLTNATKKYSKNKNLQTKESVDIANAHYQKMGYSLNHSEFIANIENFAISKNSLSPEISSSHGIILPFKGGNNEQMASRISNRSERESSTAIKDLVSISKSEIYIKSESGKRINISWAFKTLDPQMIDADGKLRHKLVQSGVVQKMEYVSKNMVLIYNWFSSNSAEFFTKISNNNASPKISLSNYNSFLDTFFSNLSPMAKIYSDLESGTSRARLNSETISLIFSDGSFKGSRENIISKASELVDFYNASQALNSIYLNLQPSLGTANSINLSTGQAEKSLAINLLDPYSLWSIISNPAMTTRFGGPIDPEDINDYKSFVIATFGLQDIVKGIVGSTGIDASTFKEDDLFDLAGFYNKSLRSKGGSPDSSLVSFAKLFNLSLDDNNRAKTYINGYPVSLGDTGKVEEIISSAETSNFIIDQSSYIEHPYRLETSLYELTESEILKIKNKLKESVDSSKVEEDILDEKLDSESLSLREKKRAELSLAANAAGKKSIENKYNKIIKEKAEIIIEGMISELMIKNEVIAETFARNERMQRGEDVMTLKELDTFSRKFGTERLNSPFNWSDYRALSMEINANLRKIVANLYNPQTKTALDFISWRKIAQSATDDDGTIIRSLYHKWWEQYLNVMAKLAS